MQAQVSYVVRIIGSCQTYACLRLARELAKFSGILDFLKNRLLRTSPRFFAWSEPNQCRKILWREISIIIKKSWTFNSPSQRDAETFKRGRATFSKMTITPERNETSSPNSEHLSKSLIWSHRKNGGVWQLGGAIKGKKTHKNGYNCATSCPTWKSVCMVLVQSATSVYKDICVSQKTRLPLADEVWAPIRQG